MRPACKVFRTASGPIGDLSYGLGGGLGAGHLDVLALLHTPVQVGLEGIHLLCRSSLAGRVEADLNRVLGNEAFGVYSPGQDDSFMIHAI